MISQIYPPKLQLNKANTSDTEAPFSDDLPLSISIGFISPRIYNKSDNFDLILKIFRFWMAMFQGYRYHKLRKVFPSYIPDTMN